MNRRGRRAVSTRLRNGSRVKGGRNERGRVAVPSISAPIIQRASDPSNPKFHSVSPNSSNSNSLFDRFHSLFTCKFYTFHILCQYAYSKAIIGDKRVTRIIRFELGNDRYRFQLTVSLITARRLFSYARRTLVIAFYFSIRLPIRLFRNRFFLLRFITRDRLLTLVRFLKEFKKRKKSTFSSSSG